MMIASPTIIAIDPGHNGGIAAHLSTDDGFLINAFRMPETEGEIASWLKLSGDAAKASNCTPVAVMEDQCGFAGAKGRVSAGAMFNFGRHFGFLLGVLQACHYRVHLVRPQKWQAALSLGSKAAAGSHTAWKNKLKTRAQQLYPDINITLATADALLILEYARMERIADNG